MLEPCCFLGIGAAFYGELVELRVWYLRDREGFGAIQGKLKVMKDSRRGSIVSKGVRFRGSLWLLRFQVFEVERLGL